MRNKIRQVVWGFLIMIFSVFITVGLFKITDKSDSKWEVKPNVALAAATSGHPNLGNSDLLEYEKNNIEIYQRCSESVVNITRVQLARMWDLETVEIPQGVGSGFVWSSDGYIVTNFHVVDGADTFLITFNKDKKQYRAKVVGISPRKDVAVLKLEERPSKLVPITVGTSKDLFVGQKVLAIGNPYGLDHTMTIGIVSAIGRQVEGGGGVKIDGMIQTDAAINPGNSGGPLLDSHGRLIGMNTAIYSRSGSSAGVGFAVPVDSISSIIPSLIKYGKEIRPGIGVSLLPDNFKERFGIEKGVVVLSVGAKSSADSAGITGMSRDSFGGLYVGDIILAINGEETNSVEDVYSILDKYKIGDVVDLTIKNKEKVRKVKIKLMKVKY